MMALYDAGDYDAAVKLAERLLKIAPDNADARDLLAMSLFQQQDYSRAISEFKQLEDLEPYRIKAIQYQVQAFYELRQFLDARALIDQVLEQEPAEVEPYLICTRLSLELADAIGAVSCAEDGLEKHAGQRRIALPAGACLYRGRVLPTTACSSFKPLLKTILKMPKYA